LALKLFTFEEQLADMELRSSLYTC